MKYYNLPTVQQIAAYHRGSLPSDKKAWIENCMKENPFVNDAVKNFPKDKVETIKEISERVSIRIQNEYGNRRLFWSKYGFWIALSSVAVIITVASILQNNPKEKYAITNVNIEKDEFIQPNLKKEKLLNTASAIEEENEEKPAVSQQTNLEIKETNKSGDASTPELSSDESEALKVKGQKENSGETKERINLSGKLLKNIRGIKLTNIDKNGLKTRELPQFPGGNSALKSHFKKFVNPIELEYGEKMYDAQALIKLTINEKGFLESSEVKGNLHEKHHEELERAIEEFPRSKPGKGSVSYELKIDFN